MNKVVQLSEASSIGIHAMVLIARSEVHMNVSDLAEKIGASRNHLAKVMQRLVKDGFVKSSRGPTGGFLLSKSPEEITLLDIYESIEGPIEPAACPLDRQVCPFGKCLMGGVVNKATIEIREYLKANTLKEMMGY
ncbi:MAG: Rrf2 family transcriptional regulator [Sphingobacteriia bacterium]|nr:Rrf2 family transcriptional regulator [Sphingobacteriia bacterium]